MNIDVHNNDDLYRKAYERLEEEPSADAWDKVAAKLDNRDARYYQQKSIRWKRTSLLLLLLLVTVLLTGVLYIATKKEALQFAGINENGKTTTADNRTQQPPVSNDSNAINQNINQRNVYATEQPEQNSTDTGASILQPAAPQPLDEVSKQNNARFGKQYSQPVQDTSIAGKEAVTQQSFSTKRDSNYRNAVVQQQVVAQKNTASTGKEEAVISKQNNTVAKWKNSTDLTSKEATASKQNNATEKQNNTLAFTSKTKAVSNKKNKEPESNQFGNITSKKRSSFERSNQKSSTYEPDNVITESDILLPLQSLNLNSFSSPSISHKEVVDSNTAAKADAMAATAFKTGTTSEDVATASTKKAIKIAQPLKQRVQLTGYASLDFSEYHLDDDNDHDNNQQPASHREDRHKIGDRENHGFSFSVGITARYQATKKFSLKSGLNYSNTTININPQTLYAAQTGSQGVAYKFVTSSGYAYVKSANGTSLSVGDSAKTGLSQHQLQFLSVPVMVGYTLYNSRRFSVIPSFGAAANFLLGTVVKTEIDEPAAAKESVTITQLNGLQRWYPSLLADAEMQYHFKPNISLNFIPSFRYAVSPLTQNNAVKTSPYSFGLGLGFTYHF